MALVAFTPEMREIKTAKGQVLAEVQGLSLEPVATLLRTHLPDLDALVELFTNKESAEAFSTEDWMKLALPIVTQAPGLVANIIALAANETDASPVKTWPLSVQIAALVVIFELTFSEIGEVKKAIGIVAALLAKKKTMTTGKATKTSKKAK